MREIRIAIVSKRVALSRFFELEAERFGIEVTVYDKASADLSEFDMCILDTEDLRRMPSLLPKRPPPLTLSRLPAFSRLALTLLSLP